MTIREAIEYLEGLYKTFSSQIEKEENCFGRMHLQTTVDALDIAISTIRAQEETPFGGWISVKDKFPEEDQEVILCTSETETYGKHREKKKIYKNIYIGYFDGYEWLTSYCHGCEYIFRMNEKYPNETIEVTHWMPLPSTEGLK